MPKSYTVQSVPHINPIEFIWKEGEIVGLRVHAELNLGEIGLPVVVDLWDEFSDTQKTKVKQIYNALKALIEAEFLST